ncbi:hypothetical protein PanWU01x14_335370, partial [Parasponia andersonii]
KFGRILAARSRSLSAYSSRAERESEVNSTADKWSPQHVSRSSCHQAVFDPVRTATVHPVLGLVTSHRFNYFDLAFLLSNQEQDKCRVHTGFQHLIPRLIPDFVEKKRK